MNGLDKSEARVTGIIISSISLVSEIDFHSDCSFLVIVTAWERIEARSMPWVYGYMEHAQTKQVSTRVV